ncbi:unnamed protein product [Pleuronectes platessa]|uniref:Uncharacterized protein n=1 Tax=Pleuronectes platessa TaxID=8262 RepID=A0A9N7YU20_PLEPL|nr:unnamed protein product [Pleuronectes platessa]
MAILKTREMQAHLFTAHRKLCCTDVGVGTSAVRDLAWRRERTRCDITWITCWTSSFTRFFRTRPHM